MAAASRRPDTGADLVTQSMSRAHVAQPPAGEALGERTNNEQIWWIRGPPEGSKGMPTQKTTSGGEVFGGGGTMASRRWSGSGSGLRTRASGGFRRKGIRSRQLQEPAVADPAIVGLGLGFGSVMCPRLLDMRMG